ncbi:MAG TPA: hypothetical protein VH115_00300 [Solirubrobacteraceae bacterium]|nr:hypothetical protein [Solirubrobacteraceae bacterium]
MAALGLITLAAAAVVLVILLGTGGRAARGGNHADATGLRAPPAAKTGLGTARNVHAPSSFAVGLRVFSLVDSSRAIELSSGQREPRTLATYVRYPALGAASGTDLPAAPAATAGGPFPLVIFGHGFAVTPALYARMLQAWTRAGYVVAAPVFPRENANAAEGPDESDLINQPRDVSFVISRLLALSRSSSGPLSGLIDPTRIAVTGHSDGGDTALAVAYNRYYRDPRVGAAVILSGAEIPGAAGFTFPPGSPPLLATQGTADTVNLPSATGVFFAAARRPKYLLTLIGAEHISPYSHQEPQLAIVDRVTIAFLDGYLKRERDALSRLAALGTVPGTAAILADP